MFTHHVTMNLKDDSHRQLSSKINQAIMPLLKKQKGFIDGATLLNLDYLTAIEDTHWQTKDDAEAYQQTGYIEVLAILSEFVSGMPKDSVFEVPVASIYQIGMEKPYIPTK